MEKYSLRADFARMSADLKVCQELVEAFNKQTTPQFDKDFELCLDLQKRFLHIADMCKQQGLNTIGRINPYIAISACANLTITVKNEYLQDGKSKNVSMLIDKIQRTLGTVVDNLNTKVLNVAIQAAAEAKQEQKVASPEPETTPTGGFKELSEAGKKLLENFKAPSQDAPQDTDESFYKKLNTRLSLEREQVKLDLEDLDNNAFKVIRGSVSVNHFFRPDAISHIDHSVISFKGISYSRQRHETIAPVHVFHDQVLVAIKVCPTQFKFRKTPLNPEERQRRMDENFNRLKLEADSDIYYNTGPFVDFTKRFQRGYLASKSFTRTRFVWFVPPAMMPLLDQIKEGAVALLWD